MSDADARELGRVIYVARLREAWGSYWTNKDRWPVDEAAWRQFPHHPAAEIELILVQARAALEWFASRADPPLPAAPKEGE